VTSRWLTASLALLLTAAPVAAQSARVIVINGDEPGIGFNDPTPAVPVGGNPGTTRGQQALNVFQRAADLWGRNLQTSQPVVVLALFSPLACTATSGTLGAAGAWNYFANVPALKQGGTALTPDTWYPAALAEKLTRQDIVVPDDLPIELIAFFNGDLGKPGCLENSGWYFGLDNQQASNQTDLLGVVLHEFGHGLGVSVGPTSASSGNRALGWPSVWEQYMSDVTTGKRWLDMTSAERAASARNNWNLVWTGAKVTNSISSTLEFLATIEADPVGTQEVGAATYGPSLARGLGLRGVLVAPDDGGGVSLQDGCEPYPAASSVAGNIVLVNRGTCSFVVKTAQAQAAGAIGVVIANNAPGFLSPGGSASGIAIPTVGVTQAYGAALRAAAPLDVRVQLDSSVRQGTTAGFARLYAPTTFAQGSSVSHFDTSLTPSVLMEPFITPDLVSKVRNPFDLTLPLLKDIGW
jgi:hypothetical protein